MLVAVLNVRDESVSLCNLGAALNVFMRQIAAEADVFFNGVIVEEIVLTDDTNL